ncbi:MAG: histidine--tRNA ligase [Bacteroidetes bacterium]|nr:histidine--tRNA ligase [Bacteroidota bacterium]
MAVQKPSIPKGTRDFSPLEMVRRNFIFDIIRNVFQVFGYQPIETPAMENLTTLMGKYGEEGDKLLFKILNSGNYLDGLPDAGSGMRDAEARLKYLTKHIAEKGLRYDLTVPFARFVVQHQNELIFPFKRYQIQPVWRADRPQKGRYREFFQCDVDVIGSNSLLNEVELAQIADAVFTKLGINVLIRLNNRKVLAGIAEAIGAPDKLTDITVAMDKLDKAGIDKVNDELILRGITYESVEKLQPILTLEGKIKMKFDTLSELFKDSETGRKGLAEMRTVLEFLKDLGLKNKFDFDITLARGLSYYTGTIFEVKALDVSMGSICGGGRYDDLTGIFGLPGMSGVGISFGADRIYDVMNESNLFPETIQAATRVLFVNFGTEEEKYCMKLLAELRQAGIPSEIYPDAAKMKKQMDYANRKNIPFVILIGKDEMATGLLTVKNMNTGEQKPYPMEEVKQLLS